MRSNGGFALVEMVDSIEKSCAAKLAENWGQYRGLSHRTLWMRDKERYARSLTKDVQGHLNAIDL